MEAYPQIAGLNETINGNKSFDETAFETVPEAKAISQQAAVEDSELEEEMNLLDFDPMSMISNLGKYATLLEKKKTVIETSDHDCGNTHFFLGNGNIINTKLWCKLGQNNKTKCFKQIQNDSNGRLRNSGFPVYNRIFTFQFFKNYGSN